MILLGNTFPLTLIRVSVRITPLSMGEAKHFLCGGFKSFWGHENTIVAASNALGIDVAPKTRRPAIGLSEKLLPSLEGKEFSDVFVFSPNYIGVYRPEIGEEVTEDKIESWQCLYLDFRV